MVALTSKTQISPLPEKSVAVATGKGEIRKICQLQRCLHLCESFPKQILILDQLKTLAVCDAHEGAGS